MINRLIEILKKQDENLRNYYKALLEVQEASVKSDVELLEKAIQHQEQVLTDIRISEKQRLELFEKLQKQYLKVEFTKMSELIELLQGRVPDDKLDEIVKLNESIKQNIIEVQQLSETNKFLINHSRNFIKEILTSILEDKNSHLLDRKM